MVNSNYFICAFFTFALLNGARQPTVEGTEWILGGSLYQLELVNIVVDLLDQLDSIPNNDTTRMNESFDTINKINSMIEGVCDHIAETKKISLDVIYRLDHFIQIRRDMEHLQEVMTDIQSRHQQMKLMSQNISSYENITMLQEFAELNVIGGSQSINSRVFDAFLTYFGDEHQQGSNIIPFVDKLAELFANAHVHNMCHMISVQQLFYNDYLEFTILEFQGYLIKKFSEIVLFNLGEGNLRKRRTNLHRLRDFRSLYIVGKFQRVISTASRELWKCDPFQWKEHENFERLTRLIQGYVVNEASIADDNSCYTTCYQMEQKKKLIECFEGDPSCDHYKGAGKLISCNSEDIHDYYTICPSSDPARRYEYIETNRGYVENNKFYGQRKSCPNKEITVESWHRGFYTCSYCFCYVDENNGKSDRFFSLLRVVSDIDKNMVVTGLKFVKINKVIHLQIQEGELAPFGMIKANTTKWNDVEKFNVKDKRDRLDYAALYYNRRSVNLDHIEAGSPDYIVTGVKLNLLGSRLYMQVQISKFDFQFGKLVEPRLNTFWIHRFPDEKRIHNDIPLQNRKVPTWHLGNVPSPTEYNSFQFTHSDKREDAAQTTLPFIDSQGVTANPPTPLSGVGLYHKGSAGYGGFLAPKIFTLNVNTYVT